MRKDQKGFVLLPILVIILILGIAGYFVFQSNSSRDLPAVQEKEVSTPSESVSPANAPEWKVYRNEEIGFEIDYPPSWQLVKDNSNTFYVIGFAKQEYENGSSDIYIKVFDNPSNLKLADYYKDISETSEMSIPNPFEFENHPPSYTSIDGKDAVKLVIPGALFNEETAIDLGDKILMINRHLDGEGNSIDKETETIYNNMIKTIKFL